jgi:hypothetical protein
MNFFYQQTKYIKEERRMKKITVLFLAIITVAFGTAWAQREMPVSGYENTGDAGAPYLNFGVVSGDSYTIEITSPVVVFEQAYRGVEMLEDTARRGHNVWVATYARNPSIFEGATIYALPLGEYWPGEGKSIGKIDFSRALTSSRISGGVAKMNFPRQKAGNHWQSVTWVVRLSDGTIGWGGHPPKYTVLNKTGSPLTVWGIVGNKTIQPDERVRDFFRTQF